MDTKERILKESLDLFSKKGFKAVTVEEIASNVGIKAPSLYKHYKGKREIFKALLDEATLRYREFISTILTSSDTIPTPEILGEKLSSLLEYSLHEEYVAPLRRIMTIEQFSSCEYGDMYSNLYVDTMLDYHISLFSKMMDKGLLKRGNPKEMALLYDAPFILLLGECDRHPEKEEEAKITLKEHAEYFFNLFSNNN
ncbi:MAG: TetR/AcrR family transcriptional regulator [Candidatus Ornithospirochaeta sp.]